MSPQNAIAGAPGLLFRVVEWGMVPGAMLWLAFRWVLWGPARSGGLRARSKRERDAARDATVAGLLVAISAFLVFYEVCHPTPVGAEPPIGQTALSAWWGLLLFPAGLLVQGAVPIIYDNECVGAIGVSGVQSFEDEQIARAGVAALK